jgi:hypothetical protein
VGDTGVELSIPPGKVTVGYDDANHTREISYADAKESIRSIRTETGPSADSG